MKPITAATLAACLAATPAFADDAELCVKSSEHEIRAAACTRMIEGSGDPHIQAVALINRAQARLALDQLDEALADADKSVALKPGMVDLRSKRGLVHSARRDYDSAFADFDAVVKADPTHFEALVNRAMMHFEKDRNDAAIADMTSAIRLQPKMVGLYTRRAAIHLDKGDVDAAIADYRQVMKLDPANEGVKAQLKDLGQ